MSVLAENWRVKNVEELTRWIGENFLLFIGPQRAYFELPLADDCYKRVVYYSVVLSASESSCCAIFQDWLKSLIPDIQATECMHALFLRSGPTYSHEEQRFCVRLGFWEKALQIKFQSVIENKHEAS